MTGAAVILVVSVYAIAALAGIAGAYVDDLIDREGVEAAHR